MIKTDGPRLAHPDALQMVRDVYDLPVYDIAVKSNTPCAKIREMESGVAPLTDDVLKAYATLTKQTEKGVWAIVGKDEKPAFTNRLRLCLIRFYRWLLKWNLS